MIYVLLSVFWFVLGWFLGALQARIYQAEIDELRFRYGKLLVENVRLKEMSESQREALQARHDFEDDVPLRSPLGAVDFSR